MSKQSSKGREWTDRIAPSILERDGYVCMLRLGGCTNDEDLTVDHVIPKSKGGTDDEWNLIAACRTCNGRKSDNQLIRLTWFDEEWFAA